MNGASVESPRFRVPERPHDFGGCGRNRKRSAQERRSPDKRPLSLLFREDELNRVLEHFQSEAKKRELIRQWIKYGDLASANTTTFVRKRLH